MPSHFDQLCQLPNWQLNKNSAQIHGNPGHFKRGNRGGPRASFPVFPSARNPKSEIRNPASTAMYRLVALALGGTPAPSSPFIAIVCVHSAWAVKCASQQYPSWIWIWIWIRSEPEAEFVLILRLCDVVATFCHPSLADSIAICFRWFPASTPARCLFRSLVWVWWGEFWELVSWRWVIHKWIPLVLAIGARALKQQGGFAARIRGHY